MQPAAQTWLARYHRRVLFACAAGMFLCWTKALLRVYHPPPLSLVVAAAPRPLSIASLGRSQTGPPERAAGDARAAGHKAFSYVPEGATRTRVEALPARSGKQV